MHLALPLSTPMKLLTNATLLVVAAAPALAQVSRGDSGLGTNLAMGDQARSETLPRGGTLRHGSAPYPATNPPMHPSASDAEPRNGSIRADHGRVDDEHIFEPKSCVPTYAQFRRSYPLYLKYAQDQYRSNGSTDASNDRRRATEHLKSLGVDLGATVSIAYALPDCLSIYELQEDAAKASYQFENYYAYLGTGLYLGTKLAEELLGCFQTKGSGKTRTQGLLALHDDHHLALTYWKPHREGKALPLPHPFKGLADSRSAGFARAYDLGAWNFSDDRSSLVGVGASTNPALNDALSPYADNEWQFSLLYYQYLSGNLNHALHSTWVKRTGFESVFLHDALARWLTVEVYGFTKPFRGAPELTTGTRSESRWKNKRSHQFSASDHRFSTLEYKEYFDDLEKRGGRVLLGQRGLGQLLTSDTTTKNQDEEVVDLKFSFVDFLIRGTGSKFNPDTRAHLRVEMLPALREWILQTQKLLRLRTPKGDSFFGVADALNLAFTTVFGFYVKEAPEFYSRLQALSMDLMRLENMGTLDSIAQKTTLLKANLDLQNLVVPRVERVWLDWAGQVYPAELKATKDIVSYTHVAGNAAANIEEHIAESVAWTMFAIDEGLVPLERRVHPDLEDLPRKRDGVLIPAPKKKKK